MSDTPPDSKPPHGWDLFRSIVGDLARPFAIYATSLSASIATVIVALRVEDGNDGAIALGAVGVLVLGIYGAKAWEVAKVAVSGQSVEK
jgi:hypothetical protein